jgi:hypothetical protein
MDHFLSSGYMANLSEDGEVSDSDSFLSLKKILARSKQVVDLTFDDDDDDDDDDAATEAS